MRISVIIPSYNRDVTLARALDSVMAQSRQADEVIVVDDGSTDKTRDLICKGYPTVRYLYQKNTGVSAARNAGIQQAKGEWLALLDSDDQWDSNKLLLQERALKSKPEYKICHTNETWIRNGVRVNPMQKHEKSGGRLFLASLPMCMISPSSVIIHRSVLGDVGLFNEALPACEDYDLWLRISAKYPVLYLSEMLTLKYGGHEDQLSKKYWGMDRFRITALDQVADNPYITNDERQAVLTILRKKIMVYLNGATKRQKTEEINYYQQLLEKHANRFINS